MSWTCPLIPIVVGNLHRIQCAEGFEKIGTERLLKKSPPVARLRGWMAADSELKPRLYHGCLTVVPLLCRRWWFQDGSW